MIGIVNPVIVLPAAHNFTPAERVCAASRDGKPVATNVEMTFSFRLG